jgi:hypothetical protein
LLSNSSVNSLIDFIIVTILSIYEANLLYYFGIAKLSEKNFHTVEFKQAALPHLPDLVAVEKFELSGTFVVVILDGDAAVPFLDLAVACP